MSIDVEKLTPAPWVIHWPDSYCAPGTRGWINSPLPQPAAYFFGDNKTDAEFIALARNDFDVKLRRGWHTEKCEEADQWVCPQAAVAALQFVWHQQGGEGKVPAGLPPTDDVFAACYQHGHDIGLLTKADRWFRENIEATEA